MSLPDLSDPRIAAFFAALIPILGLVTWLGGFKRTDGWFTPERCGVMTLVAMVAAQSLLYDGPRANVFDELDTVALTSDLIGFAGFTLIALNADRVWPLFAAGFQLIAVVAHIVRAMRLESAMAEHAYNVLKAVPTSVVIVFVLIGALWRLKRALRGEAIREWVPFKKYAEIRRLPDEVSDF